MSDAAYVEIEWIGTPADGVVARASAALGDVDSDAPSLTREGARCRWRKPTFGFDTAEGIANFLGRFHPVRVRMAWGWEATQEDAARKPWQEMTIAVPGWAREAVANGWSPPVDWMPSPVPATGSTSSATLVR